MLRRDRVSLLHGMSSLLQPGPTCCICPTCTFTTKTRGTNSTRKNQLGRLNQIHWLNQIHHKINLFIQLNHKKNNFEILQSNKRKIFYTNFRSQSLVANIPPPCKGIEDMTPLKVNLSRSKAKQTDNNDFKFIPTHSDTHFYVNVLLKIQPNFK